MNDDLVGRTALITGAAGTLGRAAGRHLASRGAAIIAADLPEQAEPLAETVRLCGQQRAGASTHHAVHFDVTAPADIRRELTLAAKDAGWPDLVFNNAGYQGHFANTLDYDTGDFARVLDINVTGLFNVLQITAQALVRDQRPGSIVNTASMAGVSGAPNMAAYSASKAAVIALTKSAAKDLAHAGIRVNAISPAFIGPGVMWDRQVRLQADTSSIYYADDPDQVADQMIGQVPLRRYGTPEEVADVVGFLLSDRSTYLTGTNTEISGGAA